MFKKYNLKQKKRINLKSTLFLQRQNEQNWRKDSYFNLFTKSV